MSLDSKIWINTLPETRKKNEGKSYDVSSDKWIETIPQKKKINKLRVYSITTTFFILGLILVSIIKNETRGLQREIDKLQASIDIIKLDLHKAEIDYEVVTSPKNLSSMAKEYLEDDLKYGHDEGASLREQAKYTDWGHEEAEAEERMNIIGQNGNDGIHYEKEVKDKTPPKKQEQSEFIKEKEEIERIIKRPLTQWEIKDLQESDVTSTFGKNKKDDNDDLVIKY